LYVINNTAIVTKENKDMYNVVEMCGPEKGRLVVWKIHERKRERAALKRAIGLKWRINNQT